MLDTWSDENNPDAPATAVRESTKSEPAIQSLVERALERELSRRRTLQPHAQLSIAGDADAVMVEEAYARLRGQYDSSAFEPYGETAVQAAKNIADLLEDAYRRMRQCAPVVLSDQPTAKLVAPATRDERVRALATLHNAIARRLNEAAEHRRAGRLHDAIRLLESVLLLDRRNQSTRSAIDELRRRLEPPPKKSLVRRLFARITALSGG
jgi:hypothetical protein